MRTGLPTCTSRYLKFFYFGCSSKSDWRIWQCEISKKYLFVALHQNHCDRIEYPTIPRHGTISPSSFHQFASTDMKICGICSKALASNQSRAQHISDVHGSYHCSTCQRTFNSETALKQHRDAKHRRSRSINRRSHTHDPPHANIQGYWIRREDFEGEKSFGRFYCPKCKKHWGSAHAYTRYGQGCQRCEIRSLPCCLWVNTGTRSYERDSEENDGPHDSRRCEACRRGVCSHLF